MDPIYQSAFPCLDKIVQKMSLVKKESLNDITENTLVRSLIFATLNSLGVLLLLNGNVLGTVFCLLLSSFSFSGGVYKGNPLKSPIFWAASVSPLLVNFLMFIFLCFLAEFFPLCIVLPLLFPVVFVPVLSSIALIAYIRQEARKIVAGENSVLHEDGHIYIEGKKMGFLSSFALLVSVAITDILKTVKRIDCYIKECFFVASH